MIIIVQHTIFDARPITKPSDLLFKPNWNNIKPFKDFISGCGQIKPRSKKGLENWIGENFICKIKKGVCDFPKVVVLNNYLIKLVGKHQYSDGYFLTKYEFVFHIKQNLFAENEKKWRNEYSHEILYELAKAILNLKVRFRNKEYKFSTSKFGNSKNEMLDLYITTSTKNEFLSTTKTEDIQIGMPQIFFQLNHYEHFNKYPRKITKINTPFLVPIKMYSWIEEILNGPHRFWLLKVNDPEVWQIARNCREIRMGVLRIHSEVECLKILLFTVLDHINPKSVDSDFFQNYINKALKIISSNEKRIKTATGIDSLTLIIKEIFIEIEPGTINNLIQKIKSKNLRRNIERNLIKKITNIYEINMNSQGNNTLQITQIPKLNNMDSLTLTRKILEFILPVFKSKAGKKIGNDFSDAINNEALILWDKIKPIFIKEDFVKIIEEDPSNEEAKLDLEYNLNKELKNNPNLSQEFFNILNKNKIESDRINISQKGDGVNIVGNVSGSNFKI